MLPVRLRLPLRARVYLLTSLVTGMHIAIVPVLPVFEDRFDISHAGIGLLVAITGLTMAAASLPAGVLTDRYGPAPVLYGAGALGVIAWVLQPLAPSFAILLVARAMVGAAEAMAWAGAGGWLAQNAPAGAKASWLSGLITWSSAGAGMAPVVVGLLAGTLGLGTTFVIGAVVLTAGTFGLVGTRATGPVGSEETGLSRPDVRVVARNIGLVAGVGLTFLSGMALGALSVLVPLGLDDSGVSTAGIGLVFGAAAVVFTLTSLFVMRRADNAARLRTALLWSGGLALSFTPAVIAAGALGAVLVMMVTCAACRAVIATIALPLAQRGGGLVGVATGTTVGLVNTAWATSSVVMPLIVGAASDTIGIAGSYVVLQLTIVAFLLAMLSRPATRAAVRSEAGILAQ